MVIEWLKFSVPVDCQAEYLRKDEEIWTKFLASCDGFVSKEVWINPDVPEEIIFVIKWETREKWQAIAPNLLAEVEQKFTEAIGCSYPLIEIKKFNIF
jgi:uncharacterized protein (TIGR03792 family)